MELRQWQINATDYLFEKNKAIFEVATGAGKTYLAISIIKQLREKYKHVKFRTLILAPKNVIIEKTWLNELTANGFGIHQIGIFNGNAKEICDITLCSIQSAHKLVELQYMDYFDFIIYDEIHNYGTENYLTIIDIDKPFKMGLSATLEREDYKHFDIMKAFGFNVFTYDITEALKDNILNAFDFKHVLLQMDDETREDYEQLCHVINGKLQALGGYHVFKDLDDNDQRKLALMKLYSQRRELIYNYERKKEAVFDILKKQPNSKVLIFNQVNKISAQLYFLLKSEGVKCGIINSDIPKKDQTQVLKDFESGKLNILLATTMLDEGYNLPKIDVAIIMGSNSTSKQFIQRMGRVLRKKERLSTVYYMTVEDTFEDEYFQDKKELIEQICHSYEVMRI